MPILNLLNYGISLKFIRHKLIEKIHYLGTIKNTFYVPKNLNNFLSLYPMELILSVDSLEMNVDIKITPNFVFWDILKNGPIFPTTQGNHFLDLLKSTFLCNYNHDARRTNAGI
jgi:hypothetical protein